MLTRPVVLCILDGVGWGRRDDGDAFALAETPHLDRLLAEAPWCLLQAHGTAVGMPSDDDMGNSEVGHNAMGAGRVFAQGAKLVGQALASGALFASDAWKRAVSTQGTLHLLGLTSDGNVHSQVDHLHALLERAAADGVSRIRVHALTDGRDVAARSALTWIRPLEARLRDLPADAAIATGGGRMLITMDRYEADWDMVQRGWDCHVHAQGRRFDSASQAIETLYAEDPEVDDQYLPAFVVGDYAGMQDGDAVILFNFRGDRALEISRAFEADDLPHLDRGRRPDVTFAGMMEYDGDLHIPRSYLVSPPEIDDTVGQRMAAAGLRVRSTSETQKFGHVTYFFNGNRSAPMPGEAPVEVPSARVPFDQLPAMSAEAVTDGVVAALEEGGWDHIRLNLANGDMVGHTGKLGPAVAAMGVVDRCVGRLVAAAAQANAVLLITADHGNVEEMFQLDRKKGAYKVDAAGVRVSSTSHSLNPVPLILVDPAGEWTLADPRRADGVVGGIAQIGGTLLALCGLEVPGHYLPSLVARG